MLGIGAIIVAVWFYLSVQKAQQKNLWGWVAAGVAIYYLSGAVWIHGFVRSILGNFYYTHDMGVQLGIKASGIVVGLLVCAFVRNRFVMKIKS